MATKRFIGWARGKDRHGTDTGLWHAVVEVEVSGGDRDHIAEAACGGRPRLAGQIEPLPADARVCNRIGCYNQLRLHPERK